LVSVISRMPPRYGRQSRACARRLVRHATAEMVLVRGNYDRYASAPLTALGTAAVDALWSAGRSRAATVRRPHPTPCAGQSRAPVRGAAGPRATPCVSRASASPPQPALLPGFGFFTGTAHVEV